MDDLISRQEAIDALGERPMVWVESDYELGARNQYDADVLALETVPSKQPEPPWIPITEKLPEEPGVYTVTNNNYEVVRYTFSGSDTSREYWERCVKAWLPLPKAYVED